MKKLKQILRGLLMSPTERAQQAFLGQAVDLADLEWRLKEISSGRFGNCPYGDCR